VYLACGHIQQIEDWDRNYRLWSREPDQTVRLAKDKQAFSDGVRACYLVYTLYASPNDGLLYQCGKLQPR